MAILLAEVLPSVLRNHAVDPVVTPLLHDDCEFVLEFDGHTIWIPAFRNTNPTFGGELVTGEAAVLKQMTKCGATGWRWKAKETVFGIYDFDSAEGSGETEGHADGYEQEVLDEVIAAARKAGYAWVRHSKGGKGFHLIVPVQPTPAMTGEHHGHNLQAILNQISADTGFDFRKYLCSTLNGWCWAAGRLPPNAFKVLVEPTKPPPLITAPPFNPQATSKPDAVFLPCHHDDIKVMQAAGYVARIDGPRLAAHSKGFESLVVATRPGCQYASTSPCRKPQVPNCWAYPQPDGGWSITRYSKTPESEAPCWHLNSKGFASASIPPLSDDELGVMTTWGLTLESIWETEAADERAAEALAAAAIGPVVSAAEVVAPEAEPTLTPAASEANLAKPEAKPAKADTRLVIPLMSFRELDASNYEEEYLIEGCLVKGQPGMIAGPQKGLKTSILMDMIISLGTGSPFLGRIPVLQTCRAVFLTGESGIATLRRTARRVCAAKGITMPEKDLWITEFLPWLTDKKHLDGIARMIEEHNLGLIVIDPLYLCMDGIDAGNLFVQGSKLRGISRICRERGVTLLLAHHTRKQGKMRNSSSYEPRELDDISWSGFGEFVRQWFLIGRREPFVPGTGEHRLWLSVGGSAGHSMLWAVDVDEAPVDNRPTAWKVTLSTPNEARTEKKEGTIYEKLLVAAKNFPGGETKSILLAAAGVPRNAATQLIFDSMVEKGVLVECKVKKGRNTWPGFKLAEVNNASA
jgi:hypothetical protein